MLIHLWNLHLDRERLGLEEAETRDFGDESFNVLTSYYSSNKKVFLNLLEFSICQFHGYSFSFGIGMGPAN